MKFGKGALHWTTGASGNKAATSLSYRSADSGASKKRAPTTKECRWYKDCLLPEFWEADITKSYVIMGNPPETPNRTPNGRIGHHTAFFYGTLMAPSVLYRVIYGEPKFEYLDPVRQMLAKNLTIEPAILHDHCRHRVQNAQYPGVIPQAGASVKGTFVTGLTDGDIWRLDAFEGSEYDRVEVKVTLLKDGEEAETAEAETYIWIAGEDSLEKREWSYEDFMKNDVGKWAGEEMKEMEDVLDKGIDPTGGRAANNADMAEKLQHDKADEKLLKKAV